MNAQLNEDIRRLIDGELDPDDVRRVLRAAADDPAARDLLFIEFRTRRTFAERRESPAMVPDGFADRVMNQVRLHASEVAKRGRQRSDIGSWLRRALESVLAPRPVMLRPAFAVVVVMLVAFGAAVVFGRFGVAPYPNPATSERVQPRLTAADAQDDEVLVPFVYVSSDARSVGVAGDFNDWEPTELQRRTLNGRIVWSGYIPISRGEHRYMFVVDGSRWESDPLAPVQRDDGFGNTNAILAL